MTDETTSETDQRPVEPGTVVYDDDGNELGIVTETTDDGFEVSIQEESLDSSEQEHNPGQEFGEGYIMWRCDECGEMGELEEGFPAECPNCGAEAVQKWRED